MPRAKIVYLDLDGVLVDFTAGAFAAHKQTLPPSTIQWDFWKQMGLTADEFWAPMGRDFWANLPWTPEGEELIATLERMVGVDRIALLTSPSDNEGSVEGKIDWVKKHLPKYRRQLFVAPAKHLAAAPCKVLIDDSHDNTDKFRLHGGEAVLIPRPWNRLNRFCDEQGGYELRLLVPTLEHHLL